MNCSKILDMGCGIGKTLSLFPIGKIIGIDSNERCIRIALERGYQVIKSNVCSLPFEDKTFDGIMRSHMI